MTDFVNEKSSILILKENMKKKMEDEPEKLDLFDYKMYKEHWKQKGEYVINNKILFLLGPCNSCKCIVTEDNKEYCENFLSIKCLECDNFSNMIQHHGFDCGCYKTRAINEMFADEDYVENNSFENRLLWTIDKYNTGCCPGYTCNINDSCYLENKFSLEALQEYGLEDEYLQNEYNLSYFFACFNCYDQVIKAEHIIFELGEDLYCPWCNTELYFFKLLKKGPFKLPDIFYKLKKYDTNKYPEIIDSSFCFRCKEDFINNPNYKVSATRQNKDVFLCWDCA